MDIVGHLPPEMAQHIILYLSTDDIDTVWNHIDEWRHLYDNSFWKTVCRRNGYEAKEYCLSSDIYRTHMLQGSYHWQAIYTYYRLIDSNWRHGNFKSISFAEEKKYDNINYLDDELLIVSIIQFPLDTTDIIDLATGNIQFSFDEEKSVKRIARHGNLLIFLVHTRVKVLNLETKSWILNLRVEEEVSSDGSDFNFSNNLLTYVNSQHCLYVINLETKKLHYKTSDVREVSFGDKIIVLIPRDYSNILKVLDFNCKTLMTINYDRMLPLDSILTKGGYVIIFYRKLPRKNKENIIVYTIQQDTKSLQEVNSVYVDYYAMHFPHDDTIFFWNIYKIGSRITYILWKFGTENHPVTFSINKDEMQLTKLNNNYMFILHNYYRLHMWCLKTGRFIKIRHTNIMNKSTSSYEVTERKLVYLKWDGSICLQDYDVIEVSANI